MPKPANPARVCRHAKRFCHGIRACPRVVIFFAACLVTVVAPGALHAQSASDSARYRLLFVVPVPPAFALPTHERILSRSEIESRVQQVLERLQHEQYYAARVDSFSFVNNTARVYVNVGARYELALTASADSVHGSRMWEQELRGKHGAAEWRARLQTVLEKFAQSGFPLACFVLDGVEEQSARGGAQRTAILHFRLQVGPHVRIDSILVRGNRTTRPHVLLRELPLRSGSPFDLTAVQDIPEKLLRLGFVREVAPPELRVNEAGQYMLVLNVVEGNSNTLNGVAGYNPAVGAQKGFLSGLLDVQLGNLFGTGRALSVHWEKRGPDTQELGLRYREPWVRGYPVHLSAGFQQLLQDTLYVTRKFDLHAEAPFANRFTLLATFARESVVPDSLSALRFNLPNSQLTSIAAGLRFDSRDDLYNPRRGFFYSTTVATGRKHVQRDSASPSFAHKLVTLDFHALVPTRAPQVLSIAFHGRQVTSSEPNVALTDQIRFGGATTLRGYREEQFRGSRVAWSNIEYRYLLSRYSRAFLFCDVGYYFRNETGAAPQAAETLTFEAVKTAYGLGVRWETAVGIIGLDYGIGEGDGLFNGKVHVSLVNSF